jgi:hypothetical protein
VVRHSAITPCGCLRNEKRAASETAILHYCMRRWRVGQRHDLMGGRLTPGSTIRPMSPRPFEVGLVIARTANQSNKIDFRQHIWLSVADQVTASLVRAPWTGFESRTEACPQDIDNTEVFVAGGPEYSAQRGSTD